MGFRFFGNPGARVLVWVWGVFRKEREKIVGEKKCFSSLSSVGKIYITIRRAYYIGSCINDAQEASQWRRLVLTMRSTGSREFSLGPVGRDALGVVISGMRTLGINLTL